MSTQPDEKLTVIREITMFQRLKFTYTNYKGETSVRDVTVLGFVYGSTPWHPEPQMLMRGYDNEKQANRTFAVKEISF